MCLLADPDDADHGIEHVVHHHAPSRDIAERRVDLLADVSERRARAGIGTGHAAIADGGKQHGHHRNENRGDHMAMTAIAEHAEYGHGRNRLNDDDAIENQVPKSKRAPQAGSPGDPGEEVVSISAYWIMAQRNCQLLKRFRQARTPRRMARLP